MTEKSKLFAPALVMSLTLMVGGNIYADPPHILTRTMFGEFITGLNRDDTLGTGTSRYRWGEGPTEFFDDWSFATMGVCDLDENGYIKPGVNGKFIDVDTPDDAELCSIADPALDQILIGHDFSALDIAKYGNKPIARMDTWRTPFAFSSDPAGNTNVEFPLPFPTDVTTPPTGSVLDVQTNTLPEIVRWTLGDWKRARGRLKIKCNLQTGRSKIELVVKYSKPNSLWTIWSVWQFPDTIDEVEIDGEIVEVPTPVIVPKPFGGVPNVFTSDPDGSVRYFREINWCPLIDDFGTTTITHPALPPNQLSRATPVVFLFHFHSDHIIYGALPTPFLGGVPPGFRIHSLLEFTLKDDERLIPPSVQATTRSGFRGDPNNYKFNGPFWKLRGPE